MKEALTNEIEDFEAGMPEVGRAVFVAPDQTFEKEMTVWLGKREAVIRQPFGEGGPVGHAELLFYFEHRSLRNTRRRRSGWPCASC